MAPHAETVEKPCVFLTRGCGRELCKAFLTSCAALSIIRCRIGDIVQLPFGVHIGLRTGDGINHIFRISHKLPISVVTQHTGFSAFPILPLDKTASVLLK